LVQIFEPDQLECKPPPKPPRSSLTYQCSFRASPPSTLMSSRTPRSTSLVSAGLYGY
jgi:hypothetical protein